MKISLKKNRKKFASVKVPVVGGKSSLSMLVKLPRCVEQQVASTSVSVSKLSSTSSQIYLTKNFNIRMAALWTTWASTCSRWWASSRAQTSLCSWSVSVDILPRMVCVYSEQNLSHLPAASARWEQNLSLVSSIWRLAPIGGQSSLILHELLFLNKFKLE